MKPILYILTLFLFVGCDFIDNNFTPTKTLKEKCEETPCTDSLCLHWDDVIQRCGTYSALTKERLRKKKDLEDIFAYYTDSTQIQHLKEIQEQIKISDSTYHEIINQLKKNNLDSIYFQTKKAIFYRNLAIINLLKENTANSHQKKTLDSNQVVR